MSTPVLPIGQRRLRGVEEATPIWRGPGQPSPAERNRDWLSRIQRWFQRRWRRLRSVS